MTYDFDSEEDGAVTVRDRDTMVKAVLRGQIPFLMKENKLQTVGAVAGYILSGGRNTRMEDRKNCSSAMRVRPSARVILHACDCLPAVYLSVDNKEPYRKTGLPMVEDRWRESGRLAALPPDF